MPNLPALGTALAMLLPFLPACASDDLPAQIDQAVGSYFTPNAPGASVIVVKDGKTIFRKSYGMADMERQIRNDASAQFRLGSVTKQFTATAILMLAEEEKLAVSDDVRKYLPAFPDKGKRITIEHLLTHTSGIANYTSLPSVRQSLTLDRTVDALIDTFKQEPLGFDPGTRYAYSNSGYILLGAIIEKASGMTYARFVEQRIFVPLKMLDTAYEGHGTSEAPRAVGHSTTATGFRLATPMSMTLPYAAGAIVSTVDDLARWDAAVTAGKLLKPASWQRAFTVHTLANGKTTGYGYGWHLDTMQGSERIAHGGGIPGFSAYAMRLPREKVFVAVLANNDRLPMSTSVVGARAAALAIGKPYPDCKPVLISAAQFDEYAGRYAGEDSAVRTFSREGDKLFMQKGGDPKEEITAGGAGRFCLPNTLVYMEFVQDAAGKINAVTVHQNDRAETSKRVYQAVTGAN